VDDEHLVVGRRRKERRCDTLDKNGALEHGTWVGAKRVLLPSSGPSVSSFVARYGVDPKAHTISFQLDGAEEQASYAVEGPVTSRGSIRGASDRPGLWATPDRTEVPSA
jgi:hypothetical protein